MPSLSRSPRWQIWNEPNLKKYFAPAPSPGQYARLLQISYPSIKQVDPKAQVVLGGMTGRGDVSAVDFLKKLYAVSVGGHGGGHRSAQPYVLLTPASAAIEINRVGGPTDAHEQEAGSRSLISAMDGDLREVHEPARQRDHPGDEHRLHADAVHELRRDPQQPPSPRGPLDNYVLLARRRA